jgi:hypothetical protein
MRISKSVCLFALGSVCLNSACSSKNGEQNTSSDPSSGYNPGGGNPGGGLLAQNTVDGRATITAAQATALTSPDAGTACAGWNVEPEGGSPPVFEFVIDTTGSMQSDPANPAQPNGPNKWTAFTQVMPTVFQSLPASFAVGVSYFHKPSNGCWTPNQAVPIAPLNAAQLAAIDGSLQAITPSGYTPTYAAWKFGLDTLTAWQAPVAYGSSPRYIVLITDGVPTVNADGCTITNPITQAEFDSEIATIQTQGTAAKVKTYVVGVVGSENPQNATYDPLYMLSKLAVAGGTAAAGCTPVTGTPSGNTVNPRGTYCHFDLSQATDFATALSSSLGSIAQSAISCNYSVPAPPPGKTIEPSKTVMVYNDGSGNYSLILQNTSGTCDKGWRFTDATNTSIEICSNTCKVLQQSPAARLNMVFGCGVGQIVT